MAHADGDDNVYEGKMDALCHVCALEGAKRCLGEVARHFVYLPA
jgi:hypothetical protein